MRFKSKKRPTDVLVHPLREKFQDFFEKPDLPFELDIHLGEEKKIRLAEYVYSIVDVRWGIVITLKSLEDITWAEEQIQACIDNPESINSWIDDETFADRQGVNERYGFVPMEHGFHGGTS